MSRRSSPPAQTLRLLLALSLFFPFSQAIPTPHTHGHKAHAKPPDDDQSKKASTFSRDFATALAVAIVAVVIGTTLICVFAHCWRQILDWGWDARRRSHDGAHVKRHRGRRRHKDEEAWFCGADRGLPMPHFDVLTSRDAETTPLSVAEVALVDCGDVTPRGNECGPAAYARHAASAAAPRARYAGDSSMAGLPSWLDPEEVERPASVAYLLDRP